MICAHDEKREHGCLPPGTSANPSANPTCRCPLARPIAAAARTRLLSLPVVLTKKARAIEAACPCAFLYKARISQLPASPKGLDAKTRLAIVRDLIPDRHNENSCPHGPRVEPAHKVQIAKRSTKKAGAKKVAKKKVAKAARGYKEHFAGSRKGKGHKWFDKIGAEQALPKIIALGVKPDTAKGWLRSWKREMRRRQIESVAG